MPDLTPAECTYRAVTELPSEMLIGDDIYRETKLRFERAVANIETVMAHNPEAVKVWRKLGINIWIEISPRLLGRG